MTNDVLSAPRVSRRVLIRFLAILTTGLSTGLIYAYAISFMPGLARVDDQTFVAAMRATNDAILSGWLFVPFVGALVCLALAAILDWRIGGGHRAWLLAALVLYAVAFFVTVGINVPLNEELAATSAGPAEARADFESIWVAWHLVRTVASTAALGCIAWVAVRRSD